MRRKRWMAALLTAILAPTLVLLGAPAAQASVVVQICTIKANYAHGSTHVNGTINATGTASCTGIVDQIFLKTTLKRADGVNYVGTSQQRNKVNYLSSSAATSCANGGRTFVTQVAYAITFPAGYSPGYVTGATYSPPIGPVCSNPGSRVAPEQVLYNEAVQLPPPPVELLVIEYTAPIN